MFTVNNKAHISVAFRLADLEAVGDTAPVESGPCNWPHPPGYVTGYGVSKTSDVRVAELLLPDIGGFMEKTQTFSAQARDSATLGAMAASSVTRTLQKLIRT